MSKITEGPWHWVNPNTDEPVDFSEPENLGALSLRTVKEYGENKTEILDGKSYTRFALPKFILDLDGSDPNHIADYRAIAALPDLIEAAKPLVKHADKYDYWGGQGDNVTISVPLGELRALRSALSKGGLRDV